MRNNLLVFLHLQYYAFMKKYPFYAGLIALPLLFSSKAVAQSNLPTTEILGAEYYYYEVGKGESLYGIAKKFGWDEKELLRLNPDVATSLNKGDKLYYPTGKVVVVSEVNDEEADLSDISPEPIRHVVKKGDTVYGIARLYNISVDTIYKNHPSAKYKIREGEVIEISQSADSFNNDGSFYFYTVKPGDTLFALAKKYNTTVEKILADNPGVSEKNFRIGDSIRIAVNSRKKMYKTELVEEERVKNINNYKVKKNDTWTSVAEKTGTTVEELRSANSDVKSLEKNEVIAVPVTEVVQVEKEVLATDPRENTPDGISEIYEEVHKITSPDTPVQENVVSIAVLVEDPSARREQEFMKGALMALENRKNSGEQIKLSVIDGTQSSEFVLSKLADAAPSVIISAHDKKFPAYLNEYCTQNATELINVFDLKSDDYVSAPFVIQYLTPSSFFTDETAEYISDNFSDYRFVYLGSEDKNDSLSETVKLKNPGKNITEYTVDNLQQVIDSKSDPIVFYAYPTDRKEVSEMLDNIIKVKEENPFADISVIGRPNWIVFADSMADKFFAADVYFPSRFYYPADSSDAKRFDSKYEELYDSSYSKSFPVYPVVGYDVMNFTIDALKDNGGDFNSTMGDMKVGLQTNVMLKRVSNWGGFYNSGCFMVRYAPFKMVDRIKIK